MAVVYNYNLTHPGTGKTASFSVNSDDGAAPGLLNSWLGQGYQVTSKTESPYYQMGPNGQSWISPTNAPTGAQTPPTMGSLPGAPLKLNLASQAATSTFLPPTGTPTTGAGIRIRMPDNTEKIFTGITPDLDAALKAGGRPLRPDNTLASLTQLNGGWLADNQPLNQFMGGDLSPDQKAALAQAGVTPLNINAGGNTQDKINSIIPAATTVGAGGAAALGSGVLPQYQGMTDLYKQMLLNDAATRNALMGGQLNLTNDALNYFNNRRDTGLSPEAKAALTTQAMEQVPAQFDRIKSDLATKLMRSGGGSLPMAGDFLRGYAPILGQEAAVKQGLLRDIVLQDEAAKEKSRQEAMQAAGLSAGLTGTIASAYDPTRYTAGLAGGLQGLLNTTNSMTSSQFQGLDLTTKLTAIGADLEPGSFKNMLLASLLSSVSQGGSNSIIAKGIGGLIDLVKGKSDASGSSGTPGAPGSTPGTVGGALSGGLGAVWGGLKDIGGAIGDGLSSAATFLANNPITIGIAGAIAGGAMWLKSQAHWEANTIVQNLENPFHFEYLAPFVSQFTQAFDSGQMTKQQAQQAKAGLLATWDLYKQKATDFGKGGSDEKKVADQSIANLQRVAIDPILASIDAAIGALA